MPIKSYLAHPHKGKKQQLLAALSSIEGCQALPAENKDVVVLVTETESREAEDALEEKLKHIKSLKFLAMVAGFNTPQN